MKGAKIVESFVAIVNPGMEVHVEEDDVGRIVGEYGCGVIGVRGACDVCEPLFHKHLDALEDGFIVVHHKECADRFRFVGGHCGGCLVVER